MSASDEFDSVSVSVTPSSPSLSASSVDQVTSPPGKSPLRAGRGGDNVKVVVRIRPLSTIEKKSNQSGPAAKVADSKHDGVGTVISLAPGRSFASAQGAKKWTYDTAISEKATPERAYQLCAADIVGSCLQDHYNGTIFAYGQTGSGKTFTMLHGEVDCLKGIIPLAFHDIFSHVAREGKACQSEDDFSHTTGPRFLIQASYLEVYNEKIRDLLVSATSDRIDLKERGGEVIGLTKCPVTGEAQLLELMLQGNGNRTTGETRMNSESSRSHSMFTVDILYAPETSGGAKVKALKSRLRLVDLAGSERLKATGAVGERAEEGRNINKSLSTLGKVIAALASGKHVPYRESMLTLLLHDSLGGNSKTAMIAHIGPAAENQQETENTLTYADDAKKIKNAPTLNVVAKGGRDDELITAMEAAHEQQRRQKTEAEHRESQAVELLSSLEEKLRLKEEERQEQELLLIDAQSRLQLVRQTSDERRAALSELERTRADLRAKQDELDAETLKREQLAESSKEVEAQMRAFLALVKGKDAKLLDLEERLRSNEAQLDLAREQSKRDKHEADELRKERDQAIAMLGTVDETKAAHERETQDRLVETMQEHSAELTALKASLVESFSSQAKSTEALHARAVESLKAEHEMVLKAKEEQRRASESELKALQLEIARIVAEKDRSHQCEIKELMSGMSKLQATHSESVASSVSKASETLKLEHKIELEAACAAAAAAAAKSAAAAAHKAKDEADFVRQEAQIAAALAPDAFDSDEQGDEARRNALLRALFPGLGLSTADLCFGSNSTVTGVKGGTVLAIAALVQLEARASARAELASAVALQDGPRLFSALRILDEASGTGGGNFGGRSLSAAGTVESGLRGSSAIPSMNDARALLKKLQAEAEAGLVDALENGTCMTLGPAAIAATAIGVLPHSANGGLELGETSSDGSEEVRGNRSGPGGPHASLILLSDKLRRALSRLDNQTAAREALEKAIVSGDREQLSMAIILAMDCPGFHDYGRTLTTAKHAIVRLELQHALRLGQSTALANAIAESEDVGGFPSDDPDLIVARLVTPTSSDKKVSESSSLSKTGDGSSAFGTLNELIIQRLDEKVPMFEACRFRLTAARAVSFDDRKGVAAHKLTWEQVEKIDEASVLLLRAWHTFYNSNGVKQLFGHYKKIVVLVLINEGTTSIKVTPLTAEEKGQTELLYDGAHVHGTFDVGQSALKPGGALIVAAWSLHSSSLFKKKVTIKLRTEVADISCPVPVASSSDRIRITNKHGGYTTRILESSASEGNHEWAKFVVRVGN